MHINHSEKIIFIHNPKAGGTTLSVAIGGYEKGLVTVAHITPDVAKKYFFQSDWDKFFSFATVRDPWDRYVSLYLYQRSEYYGDFTSQNFSHRLARNLTFAEWAKYNIISNKKSKWFGVPQANWWSGVSRVFKFEAMDEIAMELSLRLNRTLIIPKLNQSVGARPSVPKSLIDYVSEIDADTISEFGYTFPA